MEDVLNAVSTVGFPIAVACFLLYDRLKTSERAIKVQERQNILLGELKLLIEILTK